MLDANKSAVLIYNLIELLKQIGDLRDSEEFNDQLFANAKLRFEAIESSIISSCPKDNEFVNFILNVADDFKTECKLLAKLGLDLDGMNDQEYKDYKKSNSKIFSDIQRINAKISQSLRDLQNNTIEFITNNSLSIKNEDRELLAQKLDGYFSDEISEYKNIIKNSKDKSKVKLPATAWTYLELEEYLNKSSKQLLLEALERMRELHKQIHEDKN